MKVNHGKEIVATKQILRAVSLVRVFPILRWSFHIQASLDLCRALNKEIPSIKRW